MTGLTDATASPGRQGQLVERGRHRRCASSWTARPDTPLLVGEHRHRPTFVVAMPVPRTGGPRWCHPQRDEPVNGLAELVGRAVHLAPLPSGLQVGLVHQPAVPHGMPAGRPRPAAACSAAPPGDAEVAGPDAAVGQQLLHVAVGQPEAPGPADRDGGDVGRDPESGTADRAAGQGASGGVSCRQSRCLDAFPANATAPLAELETCQPARGTVTAARRASVYPEVAQARHSPCRRGATSLKRRRRFLGFASGAGPAMGVVASPGARPPTQNRSPAARS